MTLIEFINETDMVLTSEMVDHNPHMDGSDIMDNYKIKLRGKRLGGSTTRLYFSKGTGHNGAVLTVGEVLDCMASDAAGIENANGFEDWCNEYGYDADSRKAEKVFKACERQARRLKRFLGSEYYEALLWNIERL